MSFLMIWQAYSRARDKDLLIGDQALYAQVCTDLWKSTGQKDTTQEQAVNNCFVCVHFYLNMWTLLGNGCTSICFLFFLPPFYKHASI